MIINLVDNAIEAMERRGQIVVETQLDAANKLTGDARYDTVSSFFSEEFGRSFRSYGDSAGHDDTSLEGDFGGDRALYRFLRGGATISAVAIATS